MSTLYSFSIVYGVDRNEIIPKTISNTRFAISTTLEQFIEFDLLGERIGATSGIGILLNLK